MSIQKIGEKEGLLKEVEKNVSIAELFFFSNKTKLNFLDGNTKNGIETTSIW